MRVKSNTQTWTIGVNCKFQNLLTQINVQQQNWYKLDAHNWRSSKALHQFEIHTQLTKTH